MVTLYSNLSPSWWEISHAEVLHISRIAFWRIVFGLFLAVGTAGILCLHSVDEQSESRSEFVDAFGSIRVLEGRLVGFPYEPLPQQTPSSERIATAARTFHGWVGRQPSSLVATEIALLRLMEGKRDLAIDFLEGALQGTSNAAYLSDLAAAYLDRAKAEEKPLDLLQAVNAADRALQIDRDLPEGLFNLALALEALQLERQAVRAWTHALAEEVDSTWTGEIRDRLARLEEARPSWDEQPKRLERAVLSGNRGEILAIVRQFPFRVRRYSEEEKLGHWAEAWLKGQTAEANKALAVARALGRARAQLYGDHLLAEVVAAIDKATPESRLNLAHGHLEYKNGISLLDRNLGSEALDRLQMASKHLKAGGSPFFLWAELGISICLHYQGAYAETFDLLLRLRSGLEPKLYPSLVARVEWILGLVEMRLLRPVESTVSYRRALMLFETLGEIENVCALHTLLAENLRLAGNAEEAWKHRLWALELARNSDSATWTHNALFDAAESALGQKLPRIALYFQNEMVEETLGRGDPLAITEALIQRSRTLSRVGKADEAAQDLTSAREWVGRIGEDGLRESTLADIEGATGEMLLRSAPAKSLKHWNYAVKFSEEKNASFILPNLYRYRAEALLRTGNPRWAEADLRSGILRYGDLRRKYGDDLPNPAYFDQEQSVFDSMVELQASYRGRLDLAFEWAEQGRAQGLLSSLDGIGVLSATKIQARLSQETTIVAFSVLRQKTLAWVITRDLISFVKIDVSADQLEAKVNLMRRALATRKPERFRSVSSDLYELLLVPLEVSDESGDLLVIVPDKALRALPFAALWSSQEGRYLIEKHPLSIALSASHFVEAQEKLSHSKVEKRSILAVGDPAFEKKTFSGLRRLPGAAKEAKEIASLYQDRQLLVGADATEEHVLSGGKTADILHIAAHALGGQGFGPFAAILLAANGDGSDSGILYAHEIYGHNFPQTELVVLAGCDTAAGDPSYGEGSTNLARPFLAGGVPTVVASLWKARDTSSRTLLVRLHQELQGERSPAEALQAAQLQALVDPKIEDRWPASWAGFQVVGGS